MYWNLNEKFDKNEIKILSKMSQKLKTNSFEL